MAPCDAKDRIRQLERLYLATGRDKDYWRGQSQQLEEEVARLREALQLVRADMRLQHGLSSKPKAGSLQSYVENSLEGCPEDWRKEPPYYVHSFWSPCRKYIVTACVPSPGREVSLVDDDGNQWESTGPSQDMTNPELALPEQNKETGNG